MVGWVQKFWFSLRHRRYSEKDGASDLFSIGSIWVRDIRRGLMPPQTSEGAFEYAGARPGTTPTDFDRGLKKAPDLQGQISGFRS